MRIDRIKVANFKNFDQLDASFAPGVNLFVGGNGSGKTSILEAINVALGGFFGSQEQKMQRGIEFDEIKITNGKREPFSSVTGFSDEINQEWTRNIKRDTRANDIKGIKVAVDFGKQFFDNFDNADDRTIAPLIAFYSTQRLFKDSSQSHKQRYDAASARRNGYLQSLKENAIKGTLNEWLGNAVTRRATKFINDIESDDLVLENVEQAIRQTLIFFMNLPEDFALKIYQDPDFGNEIYVNYDNEHNLPLSYYSDGFRNLIYLIFDLVWRASQLNPWLKLTELSANVNGVVTIDEIDLHLHPRWQAKAVAMLQKLFPKVQFFITTHSPTVVANLEEGTLYEVNNKTVIKSENDFFGKKINYILRDVLDASDRHVQTQQKLDKLFVLIDNDVINEYEPLLLQLKALLGDDDPDIIKAQALIDWRNEDKQQLE
ncbi:AAA family ATPase [Pedobacter sp. WC2423]|uniref:AAA family ATPase n=1 Tax=Pedobacter sp. WC2423 TaxID=3234142 RepID=UPI003467C745